MSVSVCITTCKLTSEGRDHYISVRSGFPVPKQTVLLPVFGTCNERTDDGDACDCTRGLTTITMYFIHPSGKFKLSLDRTAKNTSR